MNYYLINAGLFGRLLECGGGSRRPGGCGRGVGIFPSVCPGFYLCAPPLKKEGDTHARAHTRTHTHTCTRPSDPHLRLLLKTGHTGRMSGHSDRPQLRPGCCPRAGHVAPLCRKLPMRAPSRWPRLTHVRHVLGPLPKPGRRELERGSAFGFGCVLFLLLARFPHRLYLMASLGEKLANHTVGPIWPDTCFPQ